MFCRSRCDEEEWLNKLSRVPISFRLIVSRIWRYLQWQANEIIVHRQPAIEYDSLWSRTLAECMLVRTFNLLFHDLARHSWHNGQEGSASRYNMVFFQSTTFTINNNTERDSIEKRSIDCCSVLAVSLFTEVVVAATTAKALQGDCGNDNQVIIDFSNNVGCL